MLQNFINFYKHEVAFDFLQETKFIGIKVFRIILQYLSNFAQDAEKICDKQKILETANIANPTLD